MYCKPNMEMPKFVADKRFILEAAKWADRTSLRCTSQKMGGWGIYGIKKQGGLRCGKRWLATGSKKRVMWRVFCANIWVTCFSMGHMLRKWQHQHDQRGKMLAFWCQKIIHWTLVQAHWGGWSVVPTILNQLELELTKSWLQLPEK